MTRTIKFVAAVLAAISVFVMPAASMPLHCMLMAPTGGSSSPCHMMGMSSPANGVQVSAAPFDHSCCQVSAARTEALTVPQVPSGREALVPPSSANALLTGVLATPVLHELLVRTAPPPSGAPQAVLCTFLI